MNCLTDIVQKGEKIILGWHQSLCYFLTLCASPSLSGLDMRVKALSRLKVLCVLLISIILMFFSSRVSNSFATLNPVCHSFINYGVRADLNTFCPHKSRGLLFFLLVLVSLLIRSLMSGRVT